MATFTIALKNVIKLTENKIGLDTYPIFDEAYRQQLNQKIIDHYWNQEIGLETIDMFQLAVRRKMNEIMPLYNQLYRSQLLVIDPFLTFKSTSHSASSGTNVSDSLNESTATNTTSSDARGRVVGSETPQSALSETGEYATSAQDSVSGSTGEGTAIDLTTGAQNASQSAEATSDASGFSGAMSSLLVQYRETFINIDMDIISELSECFMQIWDNGDSYSRGTSPYPFGVSW